MINKFQGNTRWLSNFQEAEFVYQGITWKTTEHAYQAMKAVNTREFLAILNCETPSIAKNLGQLVEMDPLWDKIKLDVMYKTNLAKYSQNSWLKNALIATDGQDLIEGNTWNDTFWGVCNGYGENNLGKILMKIREELCSTL